MGIDEEIKAKKEELKQLKANLQERKAAERLQRRAERTQRDSRLKTERDVVNAVKQCLFDYNKKGKQGKVEFNLKRELKLIIDTLEEVRQNE